jgi:uncharacterized protein
MSSPDIDPPSDVSSGVLIGSAPRVETEPAERRLDRRVVRLWRAGLAVQTLFWTGAVAAAMSVARVPDAWVAAAAVPLLLGVALILFWAPAQYRYWAFRTRERDLYVRSGVMWRSVAVIPYSRIQHVDTQHGPLERWLGLARLVVYTAGVRGADVTIPGLAADEAEALREQLAAVGGSEDAV